MQENVHKQKKEPLAQPTTPQDLSQSQDPIGQYMQPPWLGGIQGGKGWRMDGLAHKNSSPPSTAGRAPYPAAAHVSCPSQQNQEETPAATSSGRHKNGNFSDCSYFSEGFVL